MYPGPYKFYYCRCMWETAWTRQKRINFCFLDNNYEYIITNDGSLVSNDIETAINMFSSTYYDFEGNAVNVSWTV